MAKRRNLSVKLPDELRSGTYANQMIIRHTREEFVIDFVNRFPPEAVVARVIVSPAHFKRMIGALDQGLGRYESTFGTVAGDVSPRTATLTDRVAPEGVSEREAEAGEPADGAEGRPQAEGAPPAAQRRSGMDRIQELLAKAPDPIKSGAYANNLQIGHSAEEFLLDFVTTFPPEGMVTARVLMHPLQVKRMISAMRDNLARYEAAHGAIIETTMPRIDPFVN